METLEGNSSANSVCAFPDNHVTKNLGNIGVKMGDGRDVGSSISLIRKVERDCFKPSNLGKSSVEHVDNDDDNDLDTLLVGRLCGDLMDEAIDGSNGGLHGGLVDVPIKESPVKRKKRGIKRRGITKKKSFLNERSVLEL